MELEEKLYRLDLLDSAETVYVTCAGACLCIRCAVLTIGSTIADVTHDTSAFFKWNTFCKPLGTAFSAVVILILYAYL